VRALQALGMTYAEIGAEIGLSPSAVGDLANGYAKAPTGMAAVQLYQLHTERCPAPPAGEAV